MPRPSGIASRYSLDEQADGAGYEVFISYLFLSHFNLFPIYWFDVILDLRILVNRQTRVYNEYVLKGVVG